jgi:hypothetical protein
MKNKSYPKLVPPIFEISEKRKKIIDDAVKYVVEKNARKKRKNMKEPRYLSEILEVIKNRKYIDDDPLNQSKFVITASLAIRLVKDAYKRGRWDYQRENNKSPFPLEKYK